MNDMIFWNKICGFVLFLMISGLFATAQNASFIKLKDASFLLKNKLNTTDSCIHYNSPNALFMGLSQVKQPISANFSTQKFGFFCREELVIEKATRIPLRFRLGSLKQCNYYEGKKE
jgi:hypothetical protein